MQYTVGRVISLRLHHHRLDRWGSKLKIGVRILIWFCWPTQFTEKHSEELRTELRTLLCVVTIGSSLKGVSSTLVRRASQNKNLVNKRV